MLETNTRTPENIGIPAVQDSASAQVDLLEERLRYNARMDATILSQRLTTQISMPNGVSGTIGEILDNQELLSAAITAAGDAYDEYYDIVAKVPSEHRERMRIGREEELDAHRGILARAKAGKYNGRSVIIGEFAQYFIGSYILGGHDVAERMAESQNGETIVFQR